MNIQVQLCGLSILILMIVFYKSHKNLQLYKETVFFIVLCIITTSLAGDILSLVAIYYRHLLPISFVNFVCKTYVITLTWGVWSALIYILSDISTIKTHKKIVRLSSVLVVLQSAVVYGLPIYIYENGSRVYTYGPAITIVYVFVGIYIFTTFAVNFIFRRRLNPRRIFATSVWMLIWLVAASIQFFNNELLLVGFASALGMLILFVIMENPEGNMERQLGCFNSYALTEYLNQLYEDKSNFGILTIYFENTQFFEEHSINEIIKNIIPLCDKTAYIFKNVNRDLVIISDSIDPLEKTYAEITSDDYITKTAGGLLFTMVPDGSAFSGTEELFGFINYAELNLRKENTPFLVTDAVMVSDFKSSFQIQREIALALEENRVEVFLQPIYSVKEKRFTSAEALIRIRKTNGEFLPPGVFIPVAENSGQILELGNRVFEKVCEFIKNTPYVRQNIKYIEVNLSVVQCEAENLAKKLISTVEKYRIDPRLINLEITETASIRAQKTLLENMKKLIDYGFTFSLDDFGKGQSNLMYAVEMPVSIIKLDYDMSKAFFTNQRAEHVVKAVIDMSHNMGLSVVAEGIETAREADAFTAIGADYMQGYYFSKPLSKQQFLDFVSRVN